MNTQKSVVDSFIFLQLDASKDEHKQMDNFGKEIPKIIHQVWMDKVEWDNTEPPAKYTSRGFPQSWKELNPDFKYIFWNKRMIYALFDSPELKKYKPFFFGRLRKKGHMTQCDFARYAIMYMIGGIYMDLDFKCVKNVSKMIAHKELLLFWEPKEHSEDYDRGISPRLCVGFIGSAKRHPFWLEWMDEISDHFDFRKTIHYNTGPTGLSEFFQKRKYHINHPEWLGNTCDIMANNAWGDLSSICRLKETKRYPKNWYKFQSKKAGKQSPFQDVFAFNIWHEGGSGWGKKTMSKKTQQEKPKVPKTKAMNTLKTNGISTVTGSSVSSSTDLILAIVLPFLVVLILAVTLALTLSPKSISSD